MKHRDHVYTRPSKELSRKRHELAPDVDAAFRELSKRVFADGALSGKLKQLIAVAVAHVTQCPYCIRGHTQAALQHGATEQEIMEAIWVGAEMRADGAFAHSVIALEAMAQEEVTAPKRSRAAVTSGGGMRRGVRRAPHGIRRVPRSSVVVPRQPMGDRRRKPPRVM